MKPQIARGCLAVAGILFISGSMMLCACPGLYALAAPFAGTAIWAGTGRARVWAKVLLVASLIATGLDTLSLVQEHRRHELRRIEETRTRGTIEPERTYAAPK
jgi:gamma-glutamylcyclotransferase (GGCT)/AIG2-like uncharacterized protein YtfP